MSANDNHTRFTNQVKSKNYVKYKSESEKQFYEAMYGGVFEYIQEQQMEDQATVRVTCLFLLYFL